MKLIQIGMIGRPHGFRGEFVLSHHSGELLPPEVKTLYLGAEKQPVRVEGLVPMPKILRVKLEGFDSDQQVKARRGVAVYIERSDLGDAGDGFFVGDLLQSEIRDLATNEKIGVLTAVEQTGPGSPDRWWARELSGQDFSFPAVASVVEKVDTDSKTIWIRNPDEYRKAN